MSAHSFHFHNIFCRRRRWERERWKTAEPTIHCWMYVQIQTSNLCHEELVRRFSAILHFTLSLPPMPASLLVRLKEVQVDVYLDQPAGSGKHHWNRANDLILRNVRWAVHYIITSIQFVWRNLCMTSYQIANVFAAILCMTSSSPMVHWWWCRFSHWECMCFLCDYIIRWSEALIKKASRTQHMDLPSVSLQVS